jgi:hypothetical protein
MKPIAWCRSKVKAPFTAWLVYEAGDRQTLVRKVAIDDETEKPGPDTLVLWSAGVRQDHAGGKGGE